MNFRSAKVFTALTSVLVLGFSSWAQANYDCTSNRNRDPILQELRKGEIRPDIVAERLDLFTCFKEFVANTQKEGWKIKPLTISLERMVYGDEGHDQTYVVAFPLVRQSPEGPVWQVRKFHYHSLFDQERFQEIVQIEE